MAQRTLRWLAVAAGLAIHGAFGTTIVAQTPVAGPPPYVSPEVLPDRRVVFRIYAPKASEVTVRGDWMETPAPRVLDKDDKGVWSATVGPLRPDFYSYSFAVDGVRTLDPKNATIKQGIASLDSMFFVPGPEAGIPGQQAGPARRRPAASGIRPARSSGQRRMHVYTPPGYDGSAATGTRCSTCCTAAATRTRAGARSAAPGSSWTT